MGRTACLAIIALVLVGCADAAPSSPVRLSATPSSPPSALGTVVETDGETDGGVAIDGDVVVDGGLAIDGDGPADGGVASAPAAAPAPRRRSPLSIFGNLQTEAPEAHMWRDAQRPQPQVRIARGPVTGALDPEMVRRVVMPVMRRARACYEHGLAAEPALGGAVTARWIITPRGAITAIESTPDVAGLTTTAACLRHALGLLSFPPADGPTSAEFTFRLSPPS